MSLLDDYARPCVLLEKTRTPDGFGGWNTEWKDGAEFSNYQALDTSMQARLAEKQGVTSVYSALVNKDFPIEYGDFFRDVGLNATFRVTSNPEEKVAPDSSSFHLKYFTAERKAVPQ